MRAVEISDSYTGLHHKHRRRALRGRRHVNLNYNVITQMTDFGRRLPSGSKHAYSFELLDTRARRNEFRGSDQRELLERWFKSASKLWQADTAGLSSITAKKRHPLYRYVVSLGPPVVPYILREMKDGPQHWFSALSEITGENAILPEHEGNMREMTIDWLNWGVQKGYI